MKPIYAILLTLLTFPKFALAQCPEDWIKTQEFSSTFGAFVMGNPVALDADGNLFQAYNYSGNVTIGDSVYQGTANRFEDFLLVKYKKNGELHWVKTSGKQKKANVSGISSGEHGEASICGFLYDSIIDLHGKTAKHSGNSAIFIADYTTTGELKDLWIPVSGKANQGNVSPSAFIAKDKQNNTYIASGFSGDINVGGQVVSTVFQKEKNYFIAKFDTGHKLIWVTNSSASIFCQPTNFSVDENGNAILGINFSSDIKLNDTTTVKNPGMAGAANALVVKYNTNGKLLWHKSAGSLGTVYSSKVEADYSGNTFTSGYFGGKVEFDGNTLFATKNEANYITKYDKSGNYLWSKEIASDSGVAVLSITALKDGRLLFAGQFTNNVQSDTLVLHTYAKGIQNGFYGLLDADGKTIMLQQVYSEKSIGVSAYGIDDELVYITGYFIDDANIAGKEIKSQGNNNFIWKTCFSRILSTPERHEKDRNTISVYPNPARNTIQFSHALANSKAIEIEIYSISGYQVFKQTLHQAQQQININHLQQGFYIVKATINNEVYFSKFVKE